MGWTAGLISLAFHVLVLFEVGVVSTSSCPTQCACSNARIDCYGRGLKEIPENIPPDAVYLDLQNNQIETVDGERLQNLTELQEISLRYNRIAHIPEGAFSDLPKLKSIHLGSNLLTSIAKDVFVNLPSMSILDLTENHLTSIDGAFDNIPTLIRLVVTKNSLEALTEEALKPLTKLIYFLASENNISSIAPTAFHSMKELSFLTLSKNPLKSLDDILSKNLHLSYLDLSECRLETVPSGLPWATRHLQLGQNNITKLTKDTFKGTRYLGIIILDENQIAEIDPGTFLPIVHLQQLWLNGNKLTSFPSPIPVNIEMLCIERNAITAIATDDFPVKSKLKQLSLKGNKITEIGPFTFSHLAGLQKLYLGGNAIAELKDRSFHGLRNLTVLEIGRNPITHIETRFAAGMHMLKTLDMSFIEDTEPFVKGNFFRDTPYLTSLDLRYSPFLARNILGSTDTLKSLWSLENLNLMDNGLETVTADLHRYFPNLKSIKLSGNMLRCDKDLVLLHDWMQRARDLFPDADNVVCASPDHLMGRVIADLPMYEFYFTTTTTVATTTTEYEGSGEVVTEEMSGGGETGSGNVEVTVTVLNTQTPMSTSTLKTTSSEASKSNTASSSRPTTEKSQPSSPESPANPSTQTNQFPETTENASESVTSATAASEYPSHKKSSILTTLFMAKTTSTVETRTLSTLQQSSLTGTATPEATHPWGNTTPRKESLSTEPSGSKVASTRTVELTSTTVAWTSTGTKATTIGSPDSNSTQPRQPATSTPSAVPTTTTTITASAAPVTSTRSNDTGQRSKVTSPAAATTTTTKTSSTGSNESGQGSSEVKGPTGSVSTRQAAKTTSTAPLASITTEIYKTSSEKPSAPNPQTTQPSTQQGPTTWPNTSSSTTTMSNEIPTLAPTPDTVTSNDIPRYGENQNWMPSVADASSDSKTIIIATSVTIILLILAVLAAAFIHRHRKKFRMVYHRAFTYTIEQSDTAFVLGDQDEPDMLPPDVTPQSRRSRSRSSRGSTGSRPSTASSGDVESFRLLT